jgi:uncharacterized protein with PIN domain
VGGTNFSGGVGGELAMMSEEEQYQRAMQQSLNEEANRAVSDFSAQETQLAMQQSLTYCGGMMATSRVGENSISPMPMAGAPSIAAQTANTNFNGTPEHLSTLRDRLMDYSMCESCAEPDGAIEAMTVLDDKSDPARATLLRYSQNLHNKGVADGATPHRAEKITKVLQSIKKRKQV